MNASLNEKLRTVKWGEYKLGDLFDVLSYKKRFDANKVSLVENGGHPYIVRQSTDNGKKGNIDENPLFLNPGNTISFGQDTATMFYQELPYFTGDKIKILKPKCIEFSKKNAQFFLSSMQKTFSSFAWGSSRFNVDTLKKQLIMLPTNNGKIDFDFMESFVAELEAERIAKLSSYLTDSRLDNYVLSSEEEKAINNYGDIRFAAFDILQIFDVKNTHNVLSDDIIAGSGKVPYLCASTENNSVSSYISYKGEYLEKGNCIFIGGKTFTVTYQECDFFSNDSHNLALYEKEIEANRAEQLYIATCIKRSLSHKYSWGDSVSKTKIKTDKIYLPIKDDKPDYDTMETLISAVQKMVIRDVMVYVNGADT